eukprot:9532580-Ditylum_brightwellii.AAC.1
MSIDSKSLLQEQECRFVGAAGDGFNHTSKLKVMTYDQAMQTKDKVVWNQAVTKEHDKMVKYKVWQPVPKGEVPAYAKVLTSTWAMKPKASGAKRARLNARGYKQVDGLHYNRHNLSVPVVNNMTVRIVMILTIMAAWTAELLDVQGAFLNGQCSEWGTGCNAVLESAAYSNAQHEVQPKQG